MEDAPTKNYARKIERLLTKRYLNLISRKNPSVFKLVERKLILQELEGESPGRGVKLARMKAYVVFWNGLTQEEQLALSGHDAKLNWLARLARTIGTSEVVHAHNKIQATTAGSIDFVLQEFRKQGVQAEQVQQFIDENAVAWFSLTGHPTNPTTVAYTEAMTRLARVITNPMATPIDLDIALNDIYETPIIGDRKTPLEEAREAINTLNVIFDTALDHKRLFEKALKKYGYSGEGVRVTHPLLTPCVWTLGDADGNPSLTPEVLNEGILLHRKSVASCYLEFLAQIVQNFNTDQKTTESLERLKLDIGQMAQGDLDGVGSAEILSLWIEDIANGIYILKDAELKIRLHDLAYLVKCFGLGFGTIDIRHNAIDILATVKRLVSLAGIDDVKPNQEQTLDYLQLKLTHWLGDEKILDRCRAVLPEQFHAVGDETAATVFGRLNVIGRNPDICEKLIIAETTHPAHILAALLLLKITGNIVGHAGSRIDLTTLSESVRDLMSLGNTLEILLENEFFRRHVASRGKIVVMIAKSDTTRQDGRGEAEYAQYEACVDAYRVVEKMRRKYPELQDVLTSIMNGGGHALQRGGGRVTEVPAVHGRAAADARVTDCGPSTLTVQGQQLGILFCPGKVALGTLEALSAQNLYTKAGVHGEMPDVHSSKTMNRQYSRMDAWLYAKTAGLAFEALAKNNLSIDRLLVRAPWLSMKAGNVSSRPGKRGEKMVGPGVTPREAQGVDPKALQGRAISGERLTAHACLPVFSVLGLLEAMETVSNQGQAARNPEKYGEGLHHLYRTHKIHRDGARATINAVTMADFDIAWPLLAGRKRPSAKEVLALSDRFRYKDEDSSNTPEVTLAFLEQYFLDVERLSYEMISGQKSKKNFLHGDGLKKLWPELQNEVSNRERSAEFSRVIECYRAQNFHDNPDKALSEIDFRITQSLYAAADVINAPVGILATRTRLEPVYETNGGIKTRFMKPESYMESDVAALLKIPPALA